MDLQVAVSSAKMENFNQMNVNINIVTWDDAFLSQNVHLIIAADVLSDKSCTILRNLAAALKPGCFICLEETATRLDLKTALKEANLMLVGKQIDFSGKSYLLLKKQRKRRDPIVMQITEKDYSWLDNAKAALRKLDSEDQEMLYVSQGEESLGKIMKEKLFAYIPAYT